MQTQARGRGDGKCGKLFCILASRIIVVFILYSALIMRNQHWQYINTRPNECGGVNAHGGPVARLDP